MYQPFFLESTGSLSDSGASNSERVSAHDASSSGKTRCCRLDELKKIKDQLTSRWPSFLKVVPIVGMGGIGKTTLAQSIYEDVEISYHFHLRAWITVSQEYKLRNLLLGVLKYIVSVADEVCELTNDELAEMLCKNLKGRRFLIVLDDIWNVEIWKDFKRIIPNDNNGSRVILTSRLMEVARDAEPNSPSHHMNCLSNQESWRLLHDEVFLGKPCPSDLVEIGKLIAKKCQGLPLTIVVVVGYLTRINKKRDCWADVAKRLDSLVTRNEEKILDILCLSYNHLPRHLKACFLYMGTFPKNSEIHVVKLTRLWSAMGFLQSEHDAEKCLQDLINRNLIMVREKKYDGAAKTCGIHDLLWDLCLREAQIGGNSISNQFNFVHSQFNSSTDNMRFSMYLRLLRVLDIQSEFFVDFPETITYLVDLRYLELKTAQISSSISKLCNLETLINRYKGWKDLPKEIWLLRHLRHLQAGAVTFDVPVGCNYHLQMLSTARFSSCTELVFSRIPSVKQLKICDINGEDAEKLSSFLSNLVYLCQLEKLNLQFSLSWGFRRQQQVPWCNFFPHGVKQLTLIGSRLQWEDMNILAMLPNIEVLKLKRDAFEGPTYEQTVEGFPRLKVLLLEELRLKYWIADTTHYPILQHLVLRHCSSLEGLPSCFGEIPTLESIELRSCGKSIEESVKTIQQEQQSLGNDLQVFCWVRDPSYVTF